MSKPHRLKLRTILTFCGLIALVFVALLNRHDLASVWHLLKHLHWYIVGLVVVVQLGSYWINGLYYRSVLRVFGYHIRVARLFEGALATNFVNYVLPSAGLAGAGYLSQVLSPEVPRGEGTLAQLTRYGLSALAVLVMLPVGFLLIFMGGDSGRAIVRITLLSTIGILALAVTILALIAHEPLCRRTVHRVAKRLQRIAPKLHVRAIDHFVDEFYVGFDLLARQKRRLVVPFGWSLVYIIIEIGTFYLAFVAFGKFPAVGIAIMAYLFANIASLFGGVLFSTGVFELGMAGTLVALGISFPLAVSVTTVYRVLNLAIGLPPGFYFYKKYLP
jgi:uncharacterized protein (TIRG00374 family)